MDIMLCAHSRGEGEDDDAIHLRCTASGNTNPGQRVHPFSLDMPGGGGKKGLGRNPARVRKVKERIYIMHTHPLDHDVPSPLIWGGGKGLVVFPARHPLRGGILLKALLCSYQSLLYISMKGCMVLRGARGW